MAQELLPPQGRRIALYSAGGAFGGTLLAMLIFWLLSGGFCCDENRVSMQKSAISMESTLNTAHQKLHS